MKKILLYVVIFLLLSLDNANAAELLQNPGFEAGLNPAPWNIGWWPQEAGGFPSPGAIHQGSFGLYTYTDTHSGESFTITTQNVSVQPGQTVTASAWIYATSTWASGSKANILIRFFATQGGQSLASYSSTGVTTGSSGWILDSITTPPAPADATLVSFGCYLIRPSGTGQSIACFDDCSLTIADTPAATLSVSPTVLGFGSDLNTRTFNITNTGSGTLTWNVTKNSDWINVSSASGTTTTETDTITVTVNRVGLELPDYNGVITVTPTTGGAKIVDVFMETVPTTAVPTQPSIVTRNGYQLMVRKRLPNGTLDIARPYIIKGAAWAPTSIGTLSDVTSRRNEFGNWYRLDIQLLKEMNANTVYVFLDFGTTPGLINTARAVLDYCYQNGIMVIMTADEDGSDNTANITSAVNAFKNHPAILMWALGNEWNLWREDRPLYYARYSTVLLAASAMQVNALQVKSLDTNHPVTSILGDINQPDQATVNNIVNNICTAVDVWGANIYRGPEFYALFTEWQGISTKPLFLSEFGTDAFHATSGWPVITGYENQAEQANYLNTQWLDIIPELSANNASKVCLGGTAFEWNDEWWKTGTGSPSTHDNGGYSTMAWNPIAHPDGFANEEWFGIVNINRERRQAYDTLQNNFSYVLRLTIPVRTKESYSSAAACETILDYIREGVASDLSQVTLYDYGHFYNLPENTNLPEMDAKAVDAVLGHYDPYDTSDPYGDGDPYKGYNYTADTYDSADPYAFRNYLRDICHWIDYPVPTTYMGSTLVSKPNTPAAIPLYGNYNHWVVINGFSSSQDPLPLAGTNPWYTPDFLVNGFWVTDPTAGGIGYDTYKTSAECEKTYFKALTTSDAYNGKFLQIAEPPPVKSKARVDMPRPEKDLANLEFVGAAPVKTQSSVGVILMAASSRTAKYPSFINRKQSWKDLVDPRLLADSEVAAAFEGAKMGKPILVKRTDAANSDYYLVPFGKREYGAFLVSGVIILDACDGYFKEASWTSEPERFLEVDEKRALLLVRNNALKDIIKELKAVSRKPEKTYVARVNKVLVKYATFLRNMSKATAALVWEPNTYSPSPYKPYWKISVDSYAWYVMQDEEIVKIK